MLVKVIKENKKKDLILFFLFVLVIDLFNLVYYNINVKL